jgi:hypothetical protein
MKNGAALITPLSGLALDLIWPYLADNATAPLFALGGPRGKLLK